jgi:hypothetical protein
MKRDFSNLIDEVYMTRLADVLHAYSAPVFQSLEDQSQALEDRILALEDQLKQLNDNRLSNAQKFYTSALIQIAAALENAHPFEKNASLICDRASDLALELTDGTFGPRTIPNSRPKLEDPEKNETLEVAGEDKTPDLEALDESSA